MGGTMSPIAATITDETPPHLRGKVASLMGVFFILLGMVIGPMITTKLAQDFGWRMAFFLIGIPGLILGAVVWRIMQKRPRGEVRLSIMQGLGIVSKNRNVFLCMLLAICSLARIYVVVSFAVLFLTRVHGHSVTISGLVFGAAAAGDLLGGFSMGAVADALHRRKLIVILSSAVACILGIMLAALPIGCPKSLLILVLFGFIFFSGGVAPLVNILIPAESVGPVWAASAIGFCNAVGEFVGAGIFPIIGGHMGDVLRPWNHHDDRWVGHGAFCNHRPLFKGDQPISCTAPQPCSKGLSRAAGGRLWAKGTHPICSYSILILGLPRGFEKDGMCPWFPLVFQDSAPICRNWERNVEDRKTLRLLRASSSIPCPE